ncbi:twin-arginine translocation signal domain-containing protein [Bradyrhizobium sp. 179]|uniref:twin-arginine translocation signal domain-containing protein n=1 Tax=Bradyrhizobium sp. 179 TaxID=2782648 RepID=UPI001FF82530|nr:twin-arginine translocation signal domain-containing protein [Bradyrhizobium sp. 179]MCK1544303.1 twin-arginine translocation signal domain-containing protein [Bradyrhizobium sp. 179]
MFTTSRRNFLKGAASTAAVGAGFAGVSDARAAETVTAVEWGGNYFEPMKKIGAKQSDVQIN